MRLFRSNYHCISDGTRVAATLGNFDGVHVGHQRLLEKINARRDAWRAQGLEAASLLVSFDPHPVVVLRKSPQLPFVSTLRQRIRWVEALDVDYLLLLHFTQLFSQTSAESFIDEILLRRAHVTHLVLGADARIGSGGRGDVSFITERLQPAGVHVEVLPYEMVEGLRVSSGQIREQLASGRLDQASRMLGRPYLYEGRVVRGDGRGRTLSFPTVNLPRGGQVLPPHGVYATRTLLADSRYDSVTNIGYRPTFQGTDLRIETHLLGFPGGDLTGERIEIAFHAKLRDEQRFDDAAALKAQILKDIARAREIFDERG